MQLGDVLDGELFSVNREVSFHVLKWEAGGLQHKALAHAVMYFVPEPLRHEANKAATDNLTKNPLYKADGIVPREVMKDEQLYSFLVRALRDKDNPAQPFCPLAQYGEFKKSLIRPVVEWLLLEYQRYVNDEYPETVTPAQAADLVDQAAGK